MRPWGGNMSLASNYFNKKFACDKQTCISLYVFQIRKNSFPPQPQTDPLISCFKILNCIGRHVTQELFHAVFLHKLNFFLRRR